jgi:hypothetical protein
LEEEVQLQDAKVVFQTEHQEEKDLQKELQDVLKALVTHQDQEDQEETNIYC